MGFGSAERSMDASGGNRPVKFTRAGKIVKVSAGTCRPAASKVTTSAPVCPPRGTQINPAPGVADMS